MKRLLILLMASVVLVLLVMKSRSAPICISGRAMGCEWRFLTHEQVDETEVRTLVAGVVEHWERVLSTWREDSDISRFNRGETASDDLKKVIAMADDLQRASAGAFDHHLLGDLTASGFGPGGSGMDLSSLGKGYAVDRVCEALEHRGIHAYIFSIAGEVRAGKGTWPVSLESPHSIQDPLREIHLSRKAMATSGNYRQWNREENGKLASHILDPRSGRPVMRTPCSVTVIGPEAALCSGWATAFFVLGPDEEPQGLPAGFRVIWQK